MRVTISVASGLILAVQSAHCFADTATVQIHNWTGFYLGGHAAYGWGGSGFNSNRARDAGVPFYGGGLAGGQLGLNWQAPFGLVLGIEADASLGNVVGARPNPATASKIDLSSTIRGRLGYAFGHLLLYGTGGVALSQIAPTQLSAPGRPLPPFMDEKLRRGWVFGGGAEWAFAARWSARVEYLPGAL